MPPNKKLKLSDAQVNAVGEQYRKLLVQTNLQVEEQRAFLKHEIERDHTLGVPARNRLLQVLPEFQLIVPGRVDKNEHTGQPQISVVYDLPDELFDYLTQDEHRLPPRLRGFLQGGVDITNEVRAAAVDPMPQTGKTKTGRE